MLLKRKYDYFAKFITWAEVLAPGRRLQRVGSRTPRPLSDEGDEGSLSGDGKGRMWSVRPRLRISRDQPWAIWASSACRQHSAHYYLVFSVFTGTRGQAEEQLWYLFLTKCIVCYWQFCVNLKNSKNQYWFMTLWLAGAGWKSWEWLVLPSAGNCSQITDRVSLKAGWILLSGPGAITTW